MRRLAKKFAASVLAMTLVLAVGTTCMAATWGSYFGASEGWYEGADGTLTKNTATAFTASMDTVGWGGVWGAQVYKTSGISVKKGQAYTLSFSIKATNVTKYVYVKIATGETLAYSTWVKVEANKTVNVSETFTAKANATSVYFGLGGDAGDRIGVTTDTDAEIRYAVLGDDYKVKLAEDANGDYTSATQITVTKFSLASAKPAKVTIKSVKNLKGKKVKVTLKKKVASAAGYQIQIATNKKFTKNKKSKTTKKKTYTIKKLKVGTKYFVRVRAYTKGKKSYGDWSAVKKVTVKK